MDQHGLYDIYSVWHVPFWQTSWFFWMITTIIFIILGVILWVMYRWYCTRTKKPLTAWEHALQKITSLQQKTYSTQEEGKQCYFMLTAVLKQYLQDRFTYPLAHKTDEEAARYLEGQSLDETLTNHAQEILRGCLLIKFANEQALNDQIHTHLDLAKTIITTTIPAKSEIKQTTQPS